MIQYNVIDHIFFGLASEKFHLKIYFQFIDSLTKLLDMYPGLKTFCSYIILNFLIVTTPDSIRTETSTPKGDCINEQTCSNERVHHHEDSLRSQFMHYATVSLVVLATFMCIIYVGTKSTVRQRLSTNNRDYDMT